MTDEGEPYFERGCALENICNSADYEESILEYCRTCTSRYCNNEYMELNEEVELYLQNQLSNPTEKISTPPMVMHSVDWYNKKLRESSPVITMKTTKTMDSTTHSTVQNYSDFATYQTTVADFKSTDTTDRPPAIEMEYVYEENKTTRLESLIENS